MLKIKNTKKFRDHCHYTEEYRDAAHGTWNLNYSVPKEIPTVFIMDLIMIIILL